AKLRDTLGIAPVLVMEGDRLEPENGFARLLHRFDRVLKTLRGGCRAKLTGGVYLNSCARNCCPIDARITGFCLCSVRPDANRFRFTRDTSVSDIDTAVSDRKIRTGSIAQCDIGVTGCHVYE